MVRLGCELKKLAGESLLVSRAVPCRARGRNGLAQPAAIRHARAGCEWAGKAQVGGVLKSFIFQARLMTPLIPVMAAAEDAAAGFIPAIYYLAPSPR